MTVDYAKIARQLEAAYARSRNRERALMAVQMGSVYELIRQAKTSQAKDALLLFEAAARELGWEGGHARLPRPFCHPHLERLYRQARRLVGDAGPDRRSRRRFEDVDYSEIHTLSRLGRKPAGKDR